MSANTSTVRLQSEDASPLHCHYFAAGTCRSCTLIETPYRSQLRTKEARCVALLPELDRWLPTFTAGDRGVRTRVKLVVGGSSGAVTLGILDEQRRGVDLRDCQIQAPEIAAVIPILATFLEWTGLPPYDVPQRRGEVKFVHLTLAPGGALMLRFVVRTQFGLDVLRSRVTRLRELVPQAAVISVNLLPQHMAVLEGEREETLWGETLPITFGTAEHPLTLHLLPQSFFQTNARVARELYAQCARWAREVAPQRVWDLYCGVGGFALHVAAALQAAGEDRVEREDRVGREDRVVPEVLGVELAAAAVESARRSAWEAGIAARFVAADAAAFALAASAAELPDLLIVNPPRRGLGEEFAAWIERSGIPSVVYSSCNPETLARDLAVMPSLSPVEGRVFDMFPHTGHLEVAVLLRRNPAAG